MFPLILINFSHFKGEEMTKTLDKLLKEAGYPDLTPEIVKDIKEKMCCVARQYYTEVNGPDSFNVEDKSYELPDGNIIEIAPKIRYTTTEILLE